MAYEETTPLRPRWCQALCSSLTWFVTASHCWHGVPSCQSQCPPLTSATQSSEYTMEAWLAWRSNALLLMSSTNRRHRLFFICRRLMIWTALLSKLHRSSYALIASFFLALCCVFSIVFISIDSKQSGEWEWKRVGLLSTGNSLPLYPDGLSVI